MSDTAVSPTAASKRRLFGPGAALAADWRRWSASGQARRTWTRPSAVQLLLLVVLWISTHPYAGIVHDSLYYNLQALHAVKPGAFAGELFFKYGSQDNFTLYTRLYAPLVGHFGPGTAHLLAFIAAQFLWFAALIWLAQDLFGPKSWVFVASCVILCDAHYGGSHVFQYGEFFATPRIFAEALVLYSIVFLVRRQIIWSVILVLAAALLHPLMAAAGAGVLLICAARQAGQATVRAKRHWRLTGAVLALVAALTVWGLLGPFRRTLAVFDDRWFEVVVQRTGYAFFSRWSPQDWALLGATTAMLIAGVLMLPRQRPILVAVLLTAAGGVAVDFVFGELARNVLVVDLQLWRSLWLAALMANASVAAIVAESSPGAAGRILFGALAVNMVARLAPGGPLMWIIPMGVGLTILAWERRSPGRVPRMLALAAWLLMVVPFATCLALGCLLSMTLGWTWVPRAIASAGALALLLAPGVRRFPRSIVVALTLVLLVGELTVVDIRGPRQKFIEKPGVPDDLKTFVSGAGGLYWEGEAPLVWIKLQQPVYYACEDGAGSMFYRGTAMEFMRKSDILKRLNSADFGQNNQQYCPAKQDAQALGPHSAADVVQVCRASPGLGMIVLDRPVPGLNAEVWRSPVTREIASATGKYETDQYFRYSCNQLE